MGVGDQDGAMQTTTAQLVRQQIGAIVVGSPGIYVANVGLLMGKGWNAVMHHLRALEANGTIAMEKINGKICLFDATAGRIQQKTGTSLLRDATNRAIARYVLQNPGRTQATVSRAVGITAVAAHRRLVQLAEAGLVQRAAVGRVCFIFPEDQMTPAFTEAGLASAPDLRLKSPAAQPLAVSAVSAVSAESILAY